MTTNLKIITTGDGSASLSVNDDVEHYHSIHGALSESKHIFLEAGFKELSQSCTELFIFEMGFGTGLNAFLTMVENADRIRINYTTIELQPLNMDLVCKLNYPEIIGKSHLRTEFEQLHTCEWNTNHPITSHFNFHKIQGDINEIELPANGFHLIYFDAFAPWFSPECWTEEVFRKMYNALLTGGVLVTYSSKGDVKRAMKSAGFIIEKLPGPKGKREFVRGRKVTGRRSCGETE